LFQATLTSPNAQLGQGFFGFSVAVSDGIVVVGAPGEFVAGTFLAGHAYLFSTTASLIATLTTPNPVKEGFFGISVSVRAGIVIVGAPNETAGGFADAGHAYLFTTTASPIATLTSPTPQTNGMFGSSVASRDGIQVVGAPGETAGGFAGAGHAYIF
jgi:hypothetical protein